MPFDGWGGWVSDRPRGTDKHVFVVDGQRYLPVVEPSEGYIGRAAVYRDSRVITMDKEERGNRKSEEPDKDATKADEHEGKDQKQDSKQERGQGSQKRS